MALKKAKPLEGQDISALGVGVAYRFVPWPALVCPYHERKSREATPPDVNSVRGRSRPFVETCSLQMLIEVICLSGFVSARPDELSQNLEHLWNERQESAFLASGAVMLRFLLPFPSSFCCPPPLLNYIAFQRCTLDAGWLTVGHIVLELSVVSLRVSLH